MASKSTLPEGFGIVGEGRVRTGDQIWVSPEEGWRPVTEADLGPMEDLAYSTRVARRIFHPEMAAIEDDG